MTSKRMISKAKVIALVLTLSMIVTLLPQLSMITNASTVLEEWSDFTDTSWHNNHPAQTFYISTAEQLAGVAELVNYGTDDFAGDTIKLMVSIDLSGRYWTPIGDSNTSFKGTFDGGNYTGSTYTHSNIVKGVTYERRFVWLC